MIHSDEESPNSFTPDSPQNEKLDTKKYAVIDQSIRIQLLRRILSKQSTIKEAAREFGVNFSTAKAILQTYRKEGRIGKKKTRDRNKSKRDLNEPNQTRKIQSMYNLEREEIKPETPQRIVPPQFNPIMSSPNLDCTGAQIALALCQRELAQQKILNLQLMMMIQNFKNITQVKEESNIIN